MDLEVQQIESALSKLRQQLEICTKDIQNLTALRYQASQDPRSVLKAITKGQIPKPLTIEFISPPKSLPPKRCIPKRTITPSSPASELTTSSTGEDSLRKISVSKARKLPGYRLVTRTNLEFAKEWKDQEEQEQDHHHR